MTANSLTVRATSDTEIVITREFDAPRDLVFDALTKPDLLKRWFGAQGWNLVECQVDLRVGGAWRFVSEGPDGMSMGQSGVYREVAPATRLVYTEAYDQQWFPGECLVTATLDERAGRTTLTITLAYTSLEVRDLVLRSPMEQGMGQSFNRLEELLLGMA